MRVGIISTSNVQVALIQEVLSPVVGELTVYDMSHVENGDLSATGVHALIVDFSDEAILNSEDVLEMLGRDEPVCVLNERELYSMSAAERQAWCNKLVDELKRSIPDLAESLDARKAEIESRNANDTWVIGCSSGGLKLSVIFLASYPRCQSVFSWSSTSPKLHSTPMSSGYANVPRGGRWLRPSMAPSLRPVPSSLSRVTPQLKYEAG